jgi:hypothetical protein
MSFVGISEYQIHRSDRDHDPAFSAPKFDASAPDTRFLTNLPHKLLGKVYVKDIAFNLAAFGEVVPSHQVIEAAVDDMSNFTLSHLFSGRLRWQCHTTNRGIAQLSNHHGMHCGYNTELLRKLGPAAAELVSSRRSVTLSLNPSICCSLKVVNEGAEWAPVCASEW